LVPLIEPGGVVCEKKQIQKSHVTVSLSYIFSTIFNFTLPDYSLAEPFFITVLQTS